MNSYLFLTYNHAYSVVLWKEASQEVGVGLKGPTLHMYNALFTADHTPLVFSVSKRLQQRRIFCTTKLTQILYPLLNLLD